MFLKIIVIVLFGSVLANASTSFIIQESKVDFLAVGKPSLLKIKGTGATMSGELTTDKNTVTGQILLNLDQFRTGIALRDQHMKEKYLETTKYPQATLKLVKIELPENFLSTKKIYESVSFEGVLNLHGTEKQISGKVNVDFTKDAPSVVADFSILVSDFKIDIPTYLGIRMTDEVKIKAEFTAKIVK